jgi:hypothetical protein
MFEEGRSRKRMIGEKKKKKKEERAKRGQKREFQGNYDEKNVKRREKEQGAIV